MAEKNLKSSLKKKYEKLPDITFNNEKTDSMCSDVKIEIDKLRNELAFPERTINDVAVSIGIVDECSRRMNTAVSEGRSQSKVPKSADRVEQPGAVLKPNDEYSKKARQKMKKDDNLKMQDSFSAFAEEFVDDFHKGHLQAFGKNDAFVKMDEVRMLQEKISKKHFEIDMLHQSRGFESKEERDRNDEIMADLMVDLEHLSTKIQYIHTEMVDHNKIVFPHRSRPADAKRSYKSSPASTASTKRSSASRKSPTKAGETSANQVRGNLSRDSMDYSIVSASTSPIANNNISEMSSHFSDNTIVE